MYINPLAFATLFPIKDMFASTALTFATALVLTITIATITVRYRVLKTATANPVDSQRNE